MLAYQNAKVSDVTVLVYQNPQCQIVKVPVYYDVRTPVFFNGRVPDCQNGNLQECQSDILSKCQFFLNAKVPDARKQNAIVPEATTSPCHNCFSVAPLCCFCSSNQINSWFSKQLSEGKFSFHKTKVWLCGGYKETTKQTIILNKGG